MIEFNLDEAIARWRRDLIAKGIARTECLDELEAHLRDDLEHSTRSGLSPESAFDRAIQRLGDGGALAGEFLKFRRGERRRWIYRGFFLGLGVFVLGAVFCYFIILPLTLTASAAYVRWLGFTQLRLEHEVYIRFATRLVLGLSACLEMPVLVLTLVKTGAVGQHSLSWARKYILIVNLILGAILAGPGIVPQLLLFIVLQGLYELGVGLARSWTCREERCESLR